MYLRFIIRVPRGRASGLFCSDYRPYEDTSLPEWLLSPIREHYEWFGEHLPIPRRFTVVSKRRHLFAGICWFRPEAREHIRHARDLARLIEEAGHSTATLKARRLGQILYSDDFQMVAKPDRHMRLNA